MAETDWPLAVFMLVCIASVGHAVAWYSYGRWLHLDFLKRARERDQAFADYQGSDGHRNPVSGSLAEPVFASHQPPSETQYQTLEATETASVSELTSSNTDTLINIHEDTALAAWTYGEHFRVFIVVAIPAFIYITAATEYYTGGRLYTLFPRLLYLVPWVIICSMNCVDGPHIFSRNKDKPFVPGSAGEAFWERLAMVSSFHFLAQALSFLAVHCWYHHSYPGQYAGTASITHWQAGADSDDDNYNDDKQGRRRRSLEEEAGDYENAAGYANIQVTWTPQSCTGWRSNSDYPDTCVSTIGTFCFLWEWKDLELEWNPAWWKHLKKEEYQNHQTSLFSCDKGFRNAWEEYPSNNNPNNNNVYGYILGDCGTCQANWLYPTDIGTHVRMISGPSTLILTSTFTSLALMAIATSRYYKRKRLQKEEQDKLNSLVVVSDGVELT